MKELEICSNAKINIGLYVLSKLKDGYHEIITLFQQIDLYDTLTFIKSNQGLKIITKHQQIPTGRENLIWKAFHLFKEKAEVRGGFEVHLKKRIPMGGGLAGGSSNAAVTLLAANKLWDNPLQKSELMKIAAQLGADVPFFIFDASAIGRGKGDILEQVNYNKNWWIVLLCPEVSISTKWVYSQTKFILTKIKKITNFRTLFENFDGNDLQDNVYNELEEIVFKRYPFLEMLKNQLKEMGAFYVSMSGSGSSIYGLFSEKERAAEVKDFFSMEKKIRTFLCRPLDTFPYSSLLT